MKPKNLRFGFAITMDNIAEHIRDVKKIMMGNISFGATNDNKSADRNIDCWKASGTTPGVANTNFTVTHSLGRIPITIVGQDTNNGGLLFRGSVAWTKTAVTLQCTTASAAYNVILA